MKTAFTKAHLFAICAGGLYVAAIGCSNSNFEGESKKSSTSGSAESKNSEDQNPALQEGDAAEKAKNAGDTGQSKAGTAAFDNASFAANAAAESGNIIGCKLPDEVNAKLGSAAGGANLWSGGGGKFMNLDVTSCPWFEAAKADNAYILVMQDDANQQTYAQRYPGPGNAINWAGCLALSLNGLVSCESLP